MKWIKHLHKVVDDRLSQFRLGFYPGQLGASHDDFGRTEVTPGWARDPHKQVRRCDSAVLDVEAPAGSTAAVASQDGVVAAPLNLGTIYDGNFALADQTVWLRARLESNPGHLDLGATRSVRVSVGPKSAELEPLALGKVSIGNGTAEVVRELHDAVAELSTLVTTMQTYLLAVSAASTSFDASGGTPAGAVAFSQALKAAVAVANTTPNVGLPFIAQRLIALTTKLKTLKE